VKEQEKKRYGRLGNIGIPGREMNTRARSGMDTKRRNQKGGGKSDDRISGRNSQYGSHESSNLDMGSDGYESEGRSTSHITVSTPHDTEESHRGGSEEDAEGRSLVRNEKRRRIIPAEASNYQRTGADSEAASSSQPWGIEDEETKEDSDVHEEENKHLREIESREAPVCSGAYDQSYLLTYIKSKPYSCPGCQARFVEMDSLRRHIREGKHETQLTLTPEALRLLICPVVPNRNFSLVY